MPTDMKLPELGENIEGGDVLRVMVKPGDAIKKDQPVLELETDKATIEVPSSADGRRQGSQGQARREGEGRPDDLHRRREGRGRGAGEGGSRAGSRQAPAAGSSRRAEACGAEAGGAKADARRQEKRKAEVVEMKPAKPGRSRRRHLRRRRPSRRRCRVDSGRAFRAPARARARRQHPGHSRLRPRRPHFDGRRHGVRAAAAVGRGRWRGRRRRPATRCPTSASGERSSASR